MIQDSIFKAYDIRGKYPDEINEEIVREIVGKLFRGKRQGINNIFHAANHKLTIIIGYDARLSSPKLYRAAIKGIMNNESRIMKKKTIIQDSRFKILTAGLVTTPMMYFLVNEYDADFGIMITASHNPKEYNGIKMVGRKAVPISGKEVLKIITSR